MFQLFEFSLKLFVFSSLLIELLLEYCDLVLFSFNIYLIRSYYDSIPTLDVISLTCVWILKFTPFAVLCFYVIAHAYGIKKGKRYYLAHLMMFQSLVLLSILVTVCLTIFYEDTIAKKKNWKFFFVTSYSLFVYYFLESDNYVMVGYLSQLGFNLYTFVVFCCHYIILSLKSKNHPHSDVEVPAVGVDLVRTLSFKY